MTPVEGDAPTDSSGLGAGGGTGATHEPMGSATYPIPAVRPGPYDGAHYRPEDSVGYLMKQAVELLSRAIDARMTAYSLTDAQWRPLLMLSRPDREVATASQLARIAGCDTGAVTRMLDRLEDKELLRRERCPDDRRVQQIALTEQGRAAATVVPYVIADVLNAHLADLRADEVETLRGLLARVVEAGRREAERCQRDTPEGEGA
jgi:DNA-binding MarR family transcriptional regulator